MEASLRKAGNTHVVIKILPCAEHSMLSPVEIDGEVTFQGLAPEYVATLTSWAKEVVNAR